MNLYKLCKYLNFFHTHHFFLSINSFDSADSVSKARGANYVKSVPIRSIFWSVFPCLWSEYRKIRTRKYSVLRHFSRSGLCSNGSYPRFYYTCKADSNTLKKFIVKNKDTRRTSGLFRTLSNIYDEAFQRK